MKKVVAKNEELERLHVRIARSGLCSRRAAEQMIIDGRVMVNGELIAEVGVKVNHEDEIRVDGLVVGIAKKYTLLLNKPAGVVTTLHDPQGRPTIVSLLPNLGVQLKPVGRLDKETDGLIIVTNDGDLAMRLMHPKYGVEKEYKATVEGIPSDKDLDKMERGVWIEGGKTAPARVVMLHAETKTERAVLSITIHEGKKRQVRLMCLGIGHPVLKLTRVRIGPFKLRGMRPGECIMLGKQELTDLRALVGLKD